MGKKKQITEPWIPAPGRTSIRNKLKDKLHVSCVKLWINKKVDVFLTSIVGILKEGL